MKRVIALCMTVLMVLTMLPAFVFAAAPASGALEGTLAVKGSLKEGETLSADLGKVKPEGVSADQLKYEWFRIDSEAAEKDKSKSISTEATYKLKSEDIGKKIKLTITGKDGGSVTGTLSTSELGPVAEKNSETAGSAAAAVPTVSPSASGEESSGSTSASVPSVSEGNSSSSVPSVSEGSSSSSVPSASEGSSAASAPSVYEGNADTDYTDPAGTQSSQSAPAAENTYTPTQPSQPSYGDSAASAGPQTSDAGTADSGSNYNSPIVVYDGGESGKISTDSLPEGTVGTEYYVQFEATQSVIRWELGNAVLPDGLTWNENDGSLSGTPEKAFSNMIRVTAVFADDTTDTKDFMLTIQEGQEPTDDPSPTENPDPDTTDKPDPTENPEPTDSPEPEPEPANLFSDVDKVDFGTLFEGYEDQEQNLSLANTGTEDAADLKMEISGDLKDYITVGKIESLEGGSSVSIRLRLGAGLAVGKYSSKLTITGSDNVELTLPISVEIKEKKYELSASDKGITFDDVTEGYPEIPAKEIKITNDSIFPVTMKAVESKNFNVYGLKDGDTIGAGASESYSVRPRTGLTQGTYEESLVFEAKEGAEVSVTVKVTVKEKEEYSFDVSWADGGNGNFGYAPLGYDDENGYAPHSRNLVIRNTGNKPLEFTQPVSNSGDKTVYSITKLEEEALKSVEPGEAIAVAVRPVTGLPADTYDEDIIVDAVNDGKDPVIGSHVTFQVVEESIYEGVALDQGTIEVKNGAKKTESGLGLPSTVKAKTSAGPIDVEVVWWGLDDAEYNPALKEEQNFTVWGSIRLPSNVLNVYKLSKYTSIGVRVLAYNPKEANTAENKIYGIAQGDVFQAGKNISFSAEGSGMNRKSSPEKGDVRYEPTYWKVTDTNAKWSTDGSWDKAPYSASFAIGDSGSYKLKVTFTKEEYDGEKWVSKEDDNDGTDVKAVSFKIKGSATVNAAKKNNPVSKVRQAVKTGDNTEILPMVLLAAAGILVIGGTGIVLRSRKKKDGK